MSTVTISTIGATVQLIATISPVDAANKNASWSTSNAVVATVSAGLVTAVSAGTATITATTQQGGRIATCTVTVSTVAVSSFTLNTATLSYLLGPGATPQQLSVASFSPPGASDTVAWTSGNTGLATVDSTGKVTAGPSATVGATVTITATAVHFPAVSQQCTVTFVSTAVPVTGVAVNPPAASVGVGGTTTLSATISPSTATNLNVTWSSSNAAVAAVSATGLVTGVSAGSAVITATTVDGGFTSSSTITVAIHVTSVGLNKSALVVPPGGVDSSLVATITPSNATDQAVTWSSSNTSLMTVSAAGSITVNAGAAIGSSAVITVTTTDGGHTASATVTVGIVVTGIALNQATLSMLAGETYDLVATVTPAAGTIFWSSSSTAVATVGATGTVTGVSAGSATITAADGTGTVTAACAVTVTAPASIPVSPALPSGGVGYLGATVALDAATGQPLVAFQDAAGSGQVARLSAGAWTVLPAPFSTTFSVDSTTAHNISLAVDPSGNPVVAYVDTSAAPTTAVATWNGTAWVPMPAPGDVTPQFISVAVAPYHSLSGTDIPETEYLAGVNSVLSPSADSLEVFDPSLGNAWVLPAVGTLQYAASASSVSIVANPAFVLPGPNSAVYVASVINGGTQLAVAAFGGANGILSTLSVASASFTSIGLDSAATPYVAYKDSTGAAVLAKGTPLANVATVSPGQADYVSLAIDARPGRNVAYISFKDGANGGVASVWKFQNGAVSPVIVNASGGAVVSGTRLVMDGGTGRLFLCYESSGTITVKEIDR